MGRFAALSVTTVHRSPFTALTNLSGVTLDDRYRLERELGRGGMATVWFARDLRHDRAVAIKILHPELAGAIGIDRFLREIRLTAQLQHPNIVPILDSGVLNAPDGTRLPWYAMSFLEGESLRGLLAREGQLGIEDALAITEAAASALGHAHRQGIVHRDIKPENVFLSGGRVFVVDFGIAKALLGSEAEKLTSTGLAIGTPAYMSPEQGFGGQVDARTDQYALATVLYEMLAGDPPFGGSTAQAIMSRRLTEPARSLLPVRSTVPQSVEASVLRALERAPADRFPDIESFAAQLRSASTVARRMVPAPSKWRALAWALPVAVVAVAGWWLVTRTGASGPPGPDSVTVDLYRRGVREYDKRTPAGVLDALALFSAAIERDSGFAPAWNGLAKSYSRAYQRTFTVPGVPHDRVLQQGLAAADRALVLDSSSADSWVTRAILSQQVDPVDLSPMHRALIRAIALDSTLPSAWHYLALYHAEQGDLARGMELWRKTVRIDPAYTQGLAFLGIGHSWQGELDSAAFWADSALAIDSNYLLGRMLAGYMAIERGDFQRAEASFESARRLSTETEVTNSLAGTALALARSGRREAQTLLRNVDSLAAQQTPLSLHTSVFVAQAHAGLGKTDRALTWLRRYRPERDRHFQLHLRCDPQFIPLRSRPGFRALLVIPAPEGTAGC